MRWHALVLVAAGALVAADDAQTDLDRFKGSWLSTAFELGGEKLPDETFHGVKTVFEGNTYVQKKGDEVIEEGTYTLDSSRTPKTIDFVIIKGRDQGKTQLGIYELRDDTLKICVAAPGATVRPPDFVTRPEDEIALVILKRETP